MNIPWKIKSAAFLIIDLFGLGKILKFIQKRLTGRGFNLSITNAMILHQNVIKKYKLSNSILVEVGAGSSLFQNIYLSQFIKNQILIDKYKLIDFELVNYSIDYLIKKGNKIKNEKKVKEISDLFKYGIKYYAPLNFSEFEENNESIDIFTSTNTLEHIPKKEIIIMFKKIYNLLKTNGLVSIKIDYADHYSFTDKKITKLNYLYYSEKNWKKYNHASHFQNRLRHYEYLKIFTNISFKIIEEKAFYSKMERCSFLEDKFKNEPRSWSATQGYILLQK